MRRSGAPGRAIAPLLVLFLFSVPLAGAQLPGVSEGEYFGATIRADQSSASIDYLGTANIQLTVVDISVTQDLGGAQPSNRIQFDTEVVGEPRGWTAYTSPSSMLTRPGDVHSVNLNIQAGAGLEEPRVVVNVNATYIPTEGPERTVQTSVLAVANPNAIVQVQTGGSTDNFRPDEHRRVPLDVSNRDYYPRMVHFEVNAPEGWVVSPPSSVQVGPRSTETVWVDVRAPQDPWFQLNPTSAAPIVVTASMEGEGISEQSVAISSTLSGFFLPGWVIPHLVLLAAGVFLFGRRSMQEAREHRLRKGKPTFPGLPPEKEARYEALKRKDPERAETMKQRLEKVYANRKEDWKEAYTRFRKGLSLDRREAQRRHDAMLAAQTRQRDKQREAEKRKRAELERQLEERRRLQSEQEELEAREESKSSKERQAKEDRLRELRRRKEALDEEDE